MKIELRDPNVIMKLSRLGSFHQSKLSFLRSFLDEFKDWEYSRDLFNLDSGGYGVAIYSFKKNKRVYSLVCFANKIDDNDRSDRVIATKWDAAFTLHDGVYARCFNIFFNYVVNNLVSLNTHIFFFLINPNNFRTSKNFRKKSN